MNNSRRLGAAIVASALALSIFGPVPGASAYIKEWNNPSAGLCVVNTPEAYEIYTEKNAVLNVLPDFAASLASINVTSDTDFKLFAVSPGGEKVEDVSEKWGLRKENGNILVRVPDSAQSGETFSLHLEAQGVSFVDRFKVTVAGFEVSGGELRVYAVPDGNVREVYTTAGNEVTIKAVGFPDGTVFRDPDLDSGWEFVKASDYTYTLQVPHDSPKDGSNYNSFFVDINCEPIPSKVPKRYGFQVYVEKVTPLWWLMLIPVGGLAIWGISTLINQQIPGSSVPGMPGQPGTPGEPEKPETPKTPDAPETPGTPDKPGESETPETPDASDAPEPGTPSAPDAPREEITSVPSGATKLDAGVRAYI